MDWISKIFLDATGHFQWGSIAALTAFFVGVITAWASIYNTKKTLKANVVSNARIELCARLLKVIFSTRSTLIEVYRSDENSNLRFN